MRRFRLSLRLRLPLAGAACALAALASTQASATASLACEFADKNAKFAVQSVVSRGVGEGLHNIDGTLEILLRGVPDDLRTIKFEQEHLTQSWIDRNDLRLRLYRERGEKEPHGYAELIIKTRRAGKSDDAPYRGEYELEVHFMPAKDGGEGKSVKARGKLTCTAG